MYDSTRHAGIEHTTRQKKGQEAACGQTHSLQDWAGMGMTGRQTKGERAMEGDHPDFNTTKPGTQLTIFLKYKQLGFELS
jgi:hypothetical protein